ncbi:twin-arginine translocase TatA/TatE family subunit [Synechococcus sp. R65.1]|jgi:sec-independent protein translocase protein TatA|uniref:twin-arginine translocase TatA/TatE family subunit n=1 Tax=unclassified Synechococcus TaxID=2626047 RepID=UPI0039C1FAF3
MAILLLSKPILAVSIFGMGLPELAVIGLIAVVVFGPKKLPELGSALGKALRSFKEEMNNPSREEESPTSAEKPKAEKVPEKDAA